MPPEYLWGGVAGTVHWKSAGLPTRRAARRMKHGRLEGRCAHGSPNRFRRFGALQARSTPGPEGRQQAVPLHCGSVIIRRRDLGLFASSPP